MDQLSKFLNKHKKDARQVQTHTWFAGGVAQNRPITLHIPLSEVPTLHKLLVQSVVNNVTAPCSISEKFPKDAPFLFVADLDFKPLHIQQWWHAHHSTLDVSRFRLELNAKLRAISLSLHEVLHQCAGSTNVQMIVSTRMPYKVHLHFPTVVVNAVLAKQIAQLFARCLRDRHSDIFQEDLVDESIYRSGLRTLYSHKGAMMPTGKRNIEVEAHEALFGKGTYRDTYNITNIETWKVEGTPSVTDLKITSTQVSPDTPLTKFGLPTSAITKRRRIASTPLPQVDLSISNNLLLYLADTFKLSISDILWDKRTTPGGNVVVPTKCRRCPFAGREHMSNHLYIVLAKEVATLKCHDSLCTTTQVVDLINVPAELKQEIELLTGHEPIAVGDQAEAVTEEMRMAAVNGSLETLSREHPRMDISEPAILRTRLGGGDNWLCRLPKNMWCPLHQREHDSASNCILMTLREQQIMCQLEPELLLETPLTAQFGNVIFGNQTINNLNITLTGTDPEIPIEGLFDRIYPIFADPVLNQLLLESFNGFSYNIAKVVHHVGRDLMGLGESREKEVWWVWNQKALRWEKNSRLAGAFLSEMIAAKYIEAQHWFRSNTTDPKLRALREAKIDSIVRRLRDKDKRLILKDVAEVFDAMGTITMDHKLDKDPYLLGFEREIYDLRTGVRKPAESTDFVSMSVGYELPQEVDFDVRKEIIETIHQIQPDNDEFQYLLTFLASTLDGRNADEIFTIWTGDGRNGKGFLQELMLKTVGDYFKSLAATMLTNERPDSSKPIPDVLHLRNKRFAAASEPEDKKQINAGFVKWLTGNDPISGCFKHENEEVNFRGQHSLILLCNKIPAINAEDKAFWRRARVQHFGLVFVDNPTPGTNERQVDRNLKLKIEGWAPQFLLLLLEYYQRYQRDGLAPTAAVMRCTNSARSENDPLTEFVQEHYEKTDKETDRIKRKDIYDALDVWCRRTGQQDLLRKKQRTQVLLKALLATYGFDLGEETDSNGKVIKVRNKRVGDDAPCPAFSYIRVKSD